MLARINHKFARLMEELDTSRNSIPHHQPRRRNSMEISTKDQVTVNNIFMTALRAHCPAPVSFPKVEVTISYDQHELPYLRINARYLADDPELNPRLMATLHTHTDGPLADAGITGVHRGHIHPTTRTGPGEPMIDPDALINTARRLLQTRRQPPTPRTSAGP